MKKIFEKLYPYNVVDFIIEVVFLLVILQEALDGQITAWEVLFWIFLAIVEIFLSFTVFYNLFNKGEREALKSAVERFSFDNIISEKWDNVKKEEDRIVLSDEDVNISISVNKSQKPQKYKEKHSFVGWNFFKVFIGKAKYRNVVSLSTENTTVNITEITKCRKSKAIKNAVGKAFCV